MRTDFRGGYLMAKSFPVHKVKSHLVYTVWEVADALGCHRQTVIRWIFSFLDSDSVP